MPVAQGSRTGRPAWRHKEAMTAAQDLKRRNERLRHVAWSGAVALIVSLLGIFAPLDEQVWALQYRLAGFEASGSMVFVGAEEDLRDPDFPQRRDELAQALRNLKRAGAQSVYIDIAFEQKSRTSSDKALNEALRSFEGNAYLVHSLVNGLRNDDVSLEETVDTVGRGVPQLGIDRVFNFMGTVWQMPYVVEHGGRSLESAAVSLSGATIGEIRGGEAQFPINYGFRLDSIPSADFESLTDPNAAARSALFRGKKVVIDLAGSDRVYTIPGNIGVPGGLLHIYAAETLKAGYIRSIPDAYLLLGGFAILFLATWWDRHVERRAVYACIFLAIPGCIALTMELGIRPSLSGVATLLLAYSALRLRTRWKKELLLIDQDTGLPTFAALTGDSQVARAHPTIIVARMHRFEEVRQSLPAELHAEYILRIIDRLNAAAPETRIYQGPGHAIAWCVAEEESELVEGHLEGLRALFASPLQVGGEQVDVGITFGVDISPSPDVARRLANAVAAAERTTETYLPIVIAETRSDEELIWNISLQARIDAALAQDEIFLVYQPKIRIDTGEMVGMEALVRWRDPVRGLIPPDSFIHQCEETGRMGHLTRHVLREACSAIAAGAKLGEARSIAVNISATLLHDRGIVAMIREVLAESGIDPRLLTLEITETYRISDMDVAATHLQELTALGMSVSMDDFGVGAASMEALMRLPFGELKIDRLFIDRLGKDPKAMAIVRSILELGRQLRISVVAEGVEDAATLHLLRNAGCPYAQGFGICRPAPLEEAVQFGDRSREVTVRLSI